MSKPTPELSIVLPAYNEERNIGPLAARLAEVLKGVPYELVFVNDASDDSTLSEIKALAARDPRVRFLSFSRNFGHMAALRAGLHAARGDAVVLMDCDFEHPPELVPRLIDEWKAGAKVVLTQRLPDAQLSTLKRGTSRAFYWVLNAIGDVEIEPGSSDFILLDRAAVDRINEFDDRDIFLRGLVRWLGFSTAKVQFTQGRRIAGQSKYSLTRMLDLALMGIVAHTIKPLRIAIHLSLIFAAIGVLMLVYSFISFLFIDHTVAGWPSIMAAIAIFGAGQFLVLGILGEYVGRLVREARNWPVYIVAETEDGVAGQAAQPAKPALAKPATVKPAPAKPEPTKPPKPAKPARSGASRA